MSQPLTPFYPIFSSKSDGQEIVSQKGSVLRNAPTQEQLDRTPNNVGVSDYYRLIEKDEPKHIDWRKKLGGMLLREVGGKQYEDKWTQSILWDLPDGYRLYEHIKSKANGEAKTVKNHSGGGHDRQDAYLYGYPKGPRKRFRSPVEFFPHLLWLSTDESRDYQNCTCRICSPAQLETEKPAAVVKPEVRIDITAGPKKDAVSVTNANAHNRAVPAQAPVRRTSASGPQQQTPAIKPSISQPGTAGPQIRAPQRLEPTPLSQPRSHDQQIDSQYNKFIARTGEVVWFFRPKTEAWGLGAVIRRWKPKERPEDRAYLIQPFSHPYDSLQPELVTTDNNLKPWLAWSAPSCTYPYLQQNPTLNYDQVDWHAALSGQYGQGIADVDASILAAKAVDTTFTLFERIKTTMEAGVEIRSWNGIFLGGEKIWVGDPVRLRLGPTGTDIMVVTSITEKVYSVKPTAPTSTPSTSTSLQSTSSKVDITGNVYSYATLPAPNPSALPQVSANGTPMRMREDMAWRNRTLVPSTRELAYWKLVSASATVHLEDIKGRWYETSILFVDLFNKAVSNKEGGNGMWMNSRGDSTGVGKVVGLPKQGRVEAFGAAVPKGLQIVEGIEDPYHQPQPPQPVQPVQPPPQQQQQQQQQQAKTGALEQHQGRNGMQGVEHGPNTTATPTATAATATTTSLTATAASTGHDAGAHASNGADAGAATAGTSEGQFALDDFMTFDGAEEPQLGFGSDYMFQ